MKSVTACSSLLTSGDATQTEQLNVVSLRSHLCGSIWDMEYFLKKHHVFLHSVVHYCIGIQMCVSVFLSGFSHCIPLLLWFSRLMMPQKNLLVMWAITTWQHVMVELKLQPLTGRVRAISTGCCSIRFVCSVSPWKWTAPLFLIIGTLVEKNSQLQDKGLEETVTATPPTVSWREMYSSGAMM